MPAKRAPEARKLRAVSRQVMVAVPRWVLSRLAVEPGDDVYFHRHRAGEVVVATKRGRVAGQPGRRDLEDELAHVTAERDRFKRGWLGKDQGTARARAAQIYGQALHVVLPIEDRLAEVTAKLDRLAALVEQLPGARRRRGARRAVEEFRAAVLHDREPAP